MTNSIHNLITREKTERRVSVVTKQN